MSRLNNNEINDKLSRYHEWKLVNNQLEREYQFKDFKEALNFINKVGESAEEQNHHPDILLYSWNKVKLTVSTHSEGGITEKDFKLLSRIEK